MDANPPLPARCGLQLKPTLQFTGVGSTFIAFTAYQAIIGHHRRLEAPYARQTAACTCNGQHTVIVDVGRANFANLGCLFFLVSYSLLSNELCLPVTSAQVKEVPALRCSTCK